MTLTSKTLTYALPHPCPAQVRLGPNGAEEVLPLGKLTAFEEAAVAELIPVLRKNIETGIAFATQEKPQAGPKEQEVVAEPPKA